MIPSVLPWQLQRGMEDCFRTTFPFANEPFKSSFDRFAIITAAREESRPHHLSHERTCQRSGGTHRWPHLEYVYAQG